ncbi:ogr/Delta-like zinc finger family protein [Azotobacter beijerinckii]|uniref:Ogr/Delta-like zinc finger n=1 Tax=Azotobacter beijerinckii TaxID=170623 RepID=A0A1I1A0V3_9GAMM|nr:ogr/Delta-like zinc finger family protein [Azotobacter beijerinckii]SFB30198.1 Ogr/Delta-like zinc finger [Azotobacter beijerinckii]
MSGSTYKLVCPHCHGRMRIRTSEGQHIFLRIAYLQCTEENCSWSVRAEFQMTHELSPSGEPNPTVNLPRAPKALRQKSWRNPRNDEQQMDFIVELESEEQ